MWPFNVLKDLEKKKKEKRDSKEFNADAKRNSVPAAAIQELSVEDQVNQYLEDNNCKAIFQGFFKKAMPDNIVEKYAKFTGKVGDPYTAGADTVIPDLEDYQDRLFKDLCNKIPGHNNEIDDILMLKSSEWITEIYPTYGGPSAG